MPRALPLALALGGLSALAFWAALFGKLGGLILVYLAPLPVFYAGLALGPMFGLLAGGVGTLLVLPIGSSAAVMHAVAVTVPAFILVRQAMLYRADASGTPTEWFPPGLLFAWLTGLAAAGICAAFLFFMAEDGGLPGHFRPAVRQALENLRSLGFQGDLDATAAALASVLPGIVATSWMLLTVANASLAQGLALRFGMALRPSPRLTEMELPAPLGLAFAACAVAAMLPGVPGALAEGLALVCAVPFFFQGCAVVHVAARRTSVPGLVLGLFYALLVVIGAMVMLVILLGLFEQWIKLRRRLKGPGG